MKQLNIAEAKAALQTLENEIKATTESLLAQVSDEPAWWKLNLVKVAESVYEALKKQATPAETEYLPAWNHDAAQLEENLTLNPLDALVMLVSLCRVDRVIGVMPRSFIESFELQWKFLALNWV